MSISKTERDARERQHSRARRRVFGVQALAAMRRGVAKRKARLKKEGSKAA